MNHSVRSISRRKFLGLLAGGAVGVAMPRVMRAATTRPASKPNIILCMTDDQGWGDTSYNGHLHLKTANLDAMAAAGIRFDRFYAAHPLCSPTRASCLTGRSPVRYRCMSWGHDLPLREVTIAEAVRTAGYATGHFGKWHIGGIPDAAGGTGRGLPESFCPKPRHPGNQGFDEWFSAGKPLTPGPPTHGHAESNFLSVRGLPARDDLCARREPNRRNDLLADGRPPSDHRCRCVLVGVRDGRQGCRSEVSNRALAKCGDSL